MERLPLREASNTSERTIVREADVVVVGSGAGGAVMAYELAAAGKRVVLLEAGPYVPSSEFTERNADMFHRLFADHGGQTNTTGDLALLQGACLGGSTVMNGAVCFRTPPEVLAEWRADYGLTDLTPERLEPFFERVEKRLSVHINNPWEINENSRILERGCEALGISHKPLSRNIRDCALTGFCLVGCASDRKQSMLVTYIPWAIEKGAEVFADTRVERVVVQGGRATGVEAEMRHPETGALVATVRVNAKVVVLAAGAVQTPLLLLKNQLADSSGQVGRNFACHPSLGFFALFPQEVRAYQGGTLGSYCDEFEPPEKGGFILEGGAAGVDFIAALAPGFGRENLAVMKRFNQLAGMVSLIHDGNVGRVEWKKGKKAITYEVSEKDKPAIRQCMIAAAEIFFAAGAEQVILPTYEPIVLNHVDEVRAAVAKVEIGPHTLRMTSYHPQGTCRMGSDPTRSVVNPQGETHDVPGLWIADASLFPTSIMVNPQISVYALATYIAEYVAASLS
jgi:choline dehydrogenase-like flavoprotein